ncbi:hypothetical protein H0H81_001335 [Sphagnurus paluster]|uniref:Uncharacterized protein n=1 Tax=Sphagnurus paluster TaxID=117069 RepID=A0A9P7FT30_9AGAR|nr:hypothetical protein H0H81_001335 [Sphagnurus paluster]
MDDFLEGHLEEQRSWAVGEQGRNGEFLQTIADFNDIFRKYQQDCEHSFMEERTQQEEVFQKADAGREAVFLNGEKRREIAFESSQDALQKVSDWYRESRAVLMVQWRRKRTDLCGAIEKSLADQYEKLLKAQENSFILMENKREEISFKVYRRSLASGQVVNKENDDQGTDSDDPLDQRGNIEVNDIPLSPLVPESYGVPGPITINRKPYYSYSPVHVHPDDSTESITPSMVSGDRDSRSTESGSKIPILQQPRCTIVVPVDCSPVIPQSLGRRVTEADGISMTMPLPTIEKSEVLFQASQQERAQAFSVQEKDADDHFRVVEDVLDAAVEHRANSYSQKAKDRLEKVQEMSSIYREYFRVSEEARDGRNLRRRRAAKATQETQSQEFEMILLMSEQRAQAEQMLEDRFTEHLKDLVEVTNKRQIDGLNQARKARWVRFRDSQIRRKEELGVTDLETLPEHTIPRWRGQFRPVSGDAIPNLGHLAHVIRCSSSRSRSPRDRIPIICGPIGPPPRRPRSLSPPVGFTPSTLVRRATLGFQEPLPIPVASGRDGTVKDCMFQASPLSTPQGGQSLEFERSQVQRQDIFEKGIKRRYRIFCANESRRQLEFQNRQQEHKARFKDEMMEHQDSFVQLRWQLNTDFRASELRREDDLHRNERFADEEFQSAQKARVLRFYRRQRELNDAFFAAEKKRFMDMESLGPSLLQVRELQQTKGYEEEQDTLERIFRKMVSHTSE